MASQVELVNMALKHIGISTGIITLTENTEHAAAANSFWDIARDAALRNYDWPFARKRLELALLSSASAAYSDRWFYQYQYPTDCVFARYLDNGLPNGGTLLSDVIEYEIEYGATGQAILANEQDAALVYTKRVTETTRWPADFAVSFSYLLASFMAPSFTKGDVFSKQQKLLQLSQVWVGVAQKNAANEVKDMVDDRESDFERSRN